MEITFSKHCIVLLLIHCFLSSMLYGITLKEEPRVSSKEILEKPMIVVICSYNNSQWYLKNLDSVFSQNYENFSVIYIDDCSSDNTGNLVEQYIFSRGLQDQCLVIKNDQRTFKMANLYKGYHICPDDAIVVELDGDDWFPHNNILSLINKIYSERDIWLTYGHYIDWPQNVSTRDIPHIIKTSIDQSMIDSNTFRKIKGCIWAGLRTYYAWLVKRIALKDVMYQGGWMQRTSDAAIMFPMFEMAGNRYHFIDDILLIHNCATALNDHKVDPKLQIEIDKYIRAQSAYSRLKTKPCGQQVATASVVVLPGGKCNFDKLINLSKHKYLTEIYVITEQHVDLPQGIQKINCGKSIRETLLRLLDTITDEFVILMQDVQVTDAITPQTMQIMQTTKARALFLEIEKSKVSGKTLVMSPTLYAWQFGYANKGLLTGNAMLHAIYSKNDLKPILQNKKIFTTVDLGTVLLDSLKPTEVGLFSYS